MPISNEPNLVAIFAEITYPVASGFDKKAIDRIVLVICRRTPTQREHRHDADQCSTRLGDSRSETFQAFQRYKYRILASIVKGRLGRIIVSNHRACEPAGFGVDAGIAATAN